MKILSSNDVNAWMNANALPKTQKEFERFLWWHALCMFGILCHKHEYEWKGDTDVQSFESLREKKKNGIKSGSNIIESLWEKKPLWQHLGVPNPTVTEFEWYILHNQTSLPATSLNMTKNPSEARKCEKCNETKSGGQWYKSKTGSNAFNCKNCYRKESLASQNKTCVKCDTTKTNGQWYRSKTVPGEYVCNKSYKKEARNKRKREINKLIKIIKKKSTVSIHTY